MLIYSYNLNLKHLSIANLHNKHSFHNAQNCSKAKNSQEKMPAVK